MNKGYPRTISHRFRANPTGGQPQTLTWSRPWYCINKCDSVATYIVAFFFLVVVVGDCIDAACSTQRAAACDAAVTLVWVLFIYAMFLFFSVFFTLPTFYFIHKTSSSGVHDV